MSDLRRMAAGRASSGKALPLDISYDDATFEPTPWTDFFDTKQIVTNERGSFAVYVSGDGEIPIVFLHGAGHSSFTWSYLVKELRNLCPNLKFLCVDFRGHGETVCENEQDLSMQSLTDDLRSVLEALCLENRKLLLVGHSLGGAVAINFVHRSQTANLSALVVIDVVEGSALQSLDTMEFYVHSIPKSFTSVSSAIYWSYTQHKVKKLESAKVSVPGQLKKETKEEYTWRVNLLSTKPFWQGWFEGMSERFLSCKVPKLLILGGNDRLDKTLMVGQMQGKFTLKYVPKCGHMLQEDEPNQTAEIIHSFLNFQQILPKKTAQ